MILDQIQKKVFVGMEMLKFGLFDAISHFNIGPRTVLRLLRALKINPGKHTEQAPSFTSHS